MIDVKVGDFIQLISFNRLIKKYDGIVLDDFYLSDIEHVYRTKMIMIR